MKTTQASYPDKDLFDIRLSVVTKGSEAAFTLDAPADFAHVEDFCVTLSTHQTRMLINQLQRAVVA